MTRLRNDINKQHTIASEIEFIGKGIHTDVPSTMRIFPAVEDHGIVFQRVDLPSKPMVQADCDFVVDTAYSTKLAHGDASVMTVEHILAAFTACGIDNALVEVNAGEIPIMDGSAKLFVDAIMAAGYIEQSASKHWIEIQENIFIEEGGSSLLLVPSSSSYQITALVDFPNTPLGSQNAQLKSLDDFEKEIAPARTFGFLSQAKQLLNNGFIKGGDASNALIIVDKKLSPKEQEQLKMDLDGQEMDLTKDFYLNTTPVRFHNEPARHKLLDVVGDLSLCGHSFWGHVVATKPGHSINVAMAKKIKAYIEGKQQTMKSQAPIYVESDPPIYDIHTVSHMLPHRYPFLMIDKVVKLSSVDILAVKNVTINEPFFQGHFPNNPIMPGVFQVEAMAQAGGLCVLSGKENPGNYDTYFLKIDECKFKRKIFPGDTMLVYMKVINPIRRGITVMAGAVYVAGQLCSEAILTAQVIDRTTL